MFAADGDGRSLYPVGGKDGGRRGRNFRIDQCEIGPAIFFDPASQAGCFKTAGKSNSINGC